MVRSAAVLLTNHIEVSDRQYGFKFLCSIFPSLIPSNMKPMPEGHTCQTASVAPCGRPQLVDCSPSADPVEIVAKVLRVNIDHTTSRHCSW